MAGYQHIETKARKNVETRLGDVVYFVRKGIEQDPLLFDIDCECKKLSGASRKQYKVCMHSLST